MCQSNDSKLFAETRDLEYFTTDTLYRYHECGECGLVFLEDPPVDQLDLIYPPHYYSYASLEKPSLPERFKRRLDARLFKRLLKRIPGEELSVLDVGGGTGWLLSMVRGLSSRIKETHEVDINAQSREIAESAGHTFHCQSIEDFAPARQFDLILMLNLIEHVSDPMSVLRSVHELLTVDGLLLIKTPNTNTLDCRLFRHRNWGGYHCPRHWVLFNRECFTKAARECRLEVAAFRYTQGAPQWTSSIMSLLSSWGLVKLSAERPMSAHPFTAPIQGLMGILDLLRLPFSKTAQMLIVLKRIP